MLCYIFPHNASDKDNLNTKQFVNYFIYLEETFQAKCDKVIVPIIKLLTVIKRNIPFYKLHPSLIIIHNIK